MNVISRKLKEHIQKIYYNLFMIFSVALKHAIITELDFVYSNNNTTQCELKIRPPIFGYQKYFSYG
jgi:hypothetical protein